PALRPGRGGAGRRAVLPHDSAKVQGRCPPPLQKQAGFDPVARQTRSGRELSSGRVPRREDSYNRASPCRSANNASSRRFETPHLSKMLLRWCFTVTSLSLKRSAVSRV